MQHYAVVDMGTNSVRLMIAHVEGGQIRADFKTLRMVRIGEGMVEQKRILPAAMARRRLAAVLVRGSITRRRSARDGRSSPAWTRASTPIVATSSFRSDGFSDVVISR